MPQQLVEEISYAGYAQPLSYHHHLTHLQQDSYSDSGRGSVTSSPASILEEGPLDATSPHHGLNILASSATNLLWRPYNLGNGELGASNVPYWGNSLAMSNPVNIPPRRSYGMGLPNGSMGYGAANNTPVRAQTNLSTTFPSTYQTNGESHMHHGRDTHYGKPFQNRTTNGEIRDVNVQSQGVEDIEEEDCPLVVDESFSSSDEENGKQDRFAFICMLKHRCVYTHSILIHTHCLEQLNLSFKSCQYKTAHW